MSTVDLGVDDQAWPLSASRTSAPASELSGAAAPLTGPEAAATLARIANALFWARPDDRLEAIPAADPPWSSSTRSRDIATPAAAAAPPPGALTTSSASAPPGEAEWRDPLASRMKLGSASPGGAPAAPIGPGAPVSASAWSPYSLGGATADAATIAPPTAAPPSPIPLPGEEELRTIFAPRPAATTAAQPVSGGAANSGVPYFLHDAAGHAAVTAPPDAVAAAPSAGARPPFDVNAIRRDFPILQERVNGRPLIWLDNGATTQKPQAVIDRLAHFYRRENSNIHRAAHTLAARATDAYEHARETVRRFINAPSVEEVVFVRGATEAINLVAQTWGRKNIGADDEILITWLEHHANIVPWQMLAQETGARLKVIPVDDSGQVRLDEYERLLGPRTRLVAMTHVSNALGTVTPAARMIEMAKRYGARTLVDGAQAVSHMRADVQALDCDFYAFSGHKVFAPTGVGVLFGKREVLDAMPPWQGGGNMIKDVTFEKTEYQAPPLRFEAGTGNIADAVGLGAALDYVERIGMENIHAYESALLAYATHRLKTVPGLTMIGVAAEKAAVLSFVLDGFRSEDVGAALSREGIAVRAGHHCAQPILRRFGVESTVRPSLAFYNTTSDIDALTAALQRIASRSPNID